MMTGVLMHVVQTGKVAVLIGEVRLPVVLPKSGSLGNVVFEVQSLSGEAMELLNDRLQGDGSRLGTVGDDVVVIGEDSPGFELPGAFGKDVEKQMLEPIAPFRGMKEVGLVTGARGDEIDSGF
jgi:hypothetical protein